MSLTREIVTNRLFAVALSLYAVNWKYPDAEELRLAASRPADLQPKVTQGYYLCYYSCYYPCCHVCSYCYVRALSLPCSYKLQCIRANCTHRDIQKVCKDRLFYTFAGANGAIETVMEHCVPAFLASTRARLGDLQDEYQHLFVVIRTVSPVPKELILLIFRFYVHHYCQKLWDVR
jgi:hypothetical protein